MHSTRKWAAALGFAAAIFMAPAALANEDPANVIYGAEFEDGKIIKATQDQLAKDAFGRAELTRKNVKESTLPATARSSRRSRTCSPPAIRTSRSRSS